jgi:hypothetical protein
MPFGTLPPAFKWTETPSNTYCNYDVLMFVSSDTLHHLMCDVYFENEMSKQESYKTF